MRKFLHSVFLVLVILAFALPANAYMISVSGPNSSIGTAPAIIPAPANALDDIVENTGMQGFNEAQGVLTTVPYTTDSGTIAAGTLVDSHMIFLNSDGDASLTHYNVTWTFDGLILGVMSDSRGNYEAASTAELGASGTNYTTTFFLSGPAAPFANRGLESGDNYTISSDMLSITVDMMVTEPGDWMRVVTAAATPVPEPSTFLLLGAGLSGVGLLRKRFKK